VLKLRSGRDPALRGFVNGLLIEAGPEKFRVYIGHLTSEEAEFAMSSFNYGIIEEAAKELYIRALCDLPPDVRDALKKAYARETKAAAKEAFKAMLKAVEIADRQKTLVCQDTGLPIYMLKLGTFVPLGRR
jgi:hypothetical protein